MITEAFFCKQSMQLASTGIVAIGYNIAADSNVSVTFKRIYWCILDGAEANRQFIQMHFPEHDPTAKRFVAFNMYTGGPMVFTVDCKVNY